MLCPTFSSEIPGEKKKWFLFSDILENANQLRLFMHSWTGCGIKKKAQGYHGLLHVVTPLTLVASPSQASHTLTLPG